MHNLVFVLIFFVTSSSFAQSDLLARNYADRGDFDKALVIYEKLYKKNPGRLDYIMNVVATHQQLEQYSEAQTLLEERLSIRPNLPQIVVELGYNYSLQKNDSIANKYYQEAQNFVTENVRYSYVIGKTFEKYSLLDQAIQLYEKAMELDSEMDFNAVLARIYGEQGDLEKMFNAYIDLVIKKPTYINIAQRNFSLYTTEDATNEGNILLRKALLKKSQDNPDILFNELLSWLFVQQKDYKKAFTQEKAIYKRMDEDINGISDLAIIAIADEAYDDARDMMNFIIEKSANPETRFRGNHFLMKIELATATPEKYTAIKEKYADLLSEYGTGKATYALQIDYNHFLAFTLNEKETAIKNLKALADERLSSYQEARVKMELADILVFDEKFNRALIYYTQIQNMVNSDVLAQEARFKVARTSYFKGDFEWAQVQLGVLKKSASQLTANDALQLSLIITDNSLEDSTQTALKKYARADLLALQNKDTEAINLLDDILTNHKGEAIEDEALLKQGKLFKKTNQFNKAEANYTKLIESFKEDILADDAYYLLAKLYEENLENSIKAKELYEQIIFNFADSIYFVEARKRFRSLRGDDIN